MSLRTPPPVKRRFLTRTHDLTPPTAALLMKLSIAATDSLGRAVSHSTIIRALLRYAEQQDATWLHAQLFPLIEREVEVGTSSGRKR
jgi:hypothetical protein